MSTLKALKRRIVSVQATQKVTGAMRMIAAAKLRRSEEAVERAYSYTHETAQMLKLLSHKQDVHWHTSFLEALGKLGSKTPSTHAEGKKVNIYLIISSARGLCGALNVNIFKHVRKKLEEDQRKGIDVRIFCIGRKGIEMIERLAPNHLVQGFDFSSKKTLEFEHAHSVAGQVFKTVEECHVESVFLFYAHFASAMSQQPMCETLLPLNYEEIEREAQRQAPQFHTDHNNDLPSFDAYIDDVYTFEPARAKILTYLIPRFVEARLFSGMLETFASEQASRMVAMDNATRNAQEMLEKLNIYYNRTRQAMITTALGEIVAGAESL